MNLKGLSASFRREMSRRLPLRSKSRQAVIALGTSRRNERRLVGWPGQAVDGAH
jgi:hypothetical protein